jgi:hypothetical protein
MGQLVFQATLGGQVNLVGPNTASTLNINVPAFAGTLASLASVTTNGVNYVNSSGQPTSGSSFVFDGTNVGIGTSSPSAKLDVRGGISTGYSSGQGVYYYNSDGTNSYEIYNAGATGAGNPILSFYQIGTGERMRIDSSGNVGIGVTPSPWVSTWSALQVKNAFIAGFSNRIYVGANSYFDGSNNRYIATDFATRYYQVNGVHAWEIAASGTAGNAITFTQAMTLDLSGNLLVGTTSSQTNASGITTVGANANSYQCVAQNTSGTSGSAVYKAQLSNASATTSSYFFFYATNGAGSTYTLRADGSSTFSSDQTLKKNIVDSRGYLEDLMKLRPVKYHWKTQEDSDPEKWLGLIAQEVEQVFPALVCEDKAEEGETPTKAVKYSVLPMMMLKAIQEMKAIIDTQASTITTLTDRITALEAK